MLFAKTLATLVLFEQIVILSLQINSNACLHSRPFLAEHFLVPLTVVSLSLFSVRAFRRVTLSDRDLVTRLSSFVYVGSMVLE